MNIEFKSRKNKKDKRINNKKIMLTEDDINLGLTAEADVAKDLKSQMKINK